MWGRQKAQHVDEPTTEGSLVIEKRFNVNRVPTVREVQDFFSLMRYGSKWHAWFSLCFLCGLRPCEIIKLTTDTIECEGNRWVALTYEVGKPKPSGRPRNGCAPTKAVRKLNRIDSRMAQIPPGALDSLRVYWHTEMRQGLGLFFPKTYLQYGKQFSMLRTKMIAMGHKSWARTNTEYFRHLRNLKGNKHDEHDITPYSGRRFFISCYHWLVSSENRNAVPDLIETQKRMAHSGNKDTMIYVHSWRHLGLQPDHIGKGWDVLTGCNPKQKRLNEFI